MEVADPRSEGAVFGLGGARQSGEALHSEQRDGDTKNGRGANVMEVRAVGVSKRAVALAPMPAHDLKPFRCRSATTTASFFSLTCSGSGHIAVQLLGAICRLRSERGS